MARKPAEAALEAADEIQTSGRQSGGRLTATFVGDPAEGEDSPQPRSIKFAGRVFKLGVETDVSDLSEDDRKRIIGHSHFETSADDEGKRERIGRRIRRGVEAAKAERRARLKAAQKGEKLADDIESDTE